MNEQNNFTQCFNVQISSVLKLITMKIFCSMMASLNILTKFQTYPVYFVRSLATVYFHQTLSPAFSLIIILYIHLILFL
jgi:hypothetical protein